MRLMQGGADCELSLCPPVGGHASAIAAITSVCRSALPLFRMTTQAGLLSADVDLAALAATARNFSGAELAGADRPKRKKRDETK